MVAEAPSRRRYAVVGTGSRAGMYVKALATTHADVGTLVAWCEPNPVRMDYHDDALRAAGLPVPARYAPGDFDGLLAGQRPDVVVVTSPDATHDRFATAALDAGCDVVVEKPLTTTLAGGKGDRGRRREVGGRPRRHVQLPLLAPERGAAAGDRLR